MQKTVRFSTIAVFLLVLLITMLLSRIEESKKAAAASAQTVPAIVYHQWLWQNKFTFGNM